MENIAPNKYPDIPRQAGATRSYQETAVKKNLLMYNPSVLTTTIINMNKGRLSLINLADQLGLHHVSNKPKKTGTTIDANDMKRLR